MQFFSNQGSDPKGNAQRNLSGRTHYVDDDTLRGHKSRVISSRSSHDGLLFYIVTSDALDMNNTRRGFRYVIFDLWGHVIDRTDIESTFRTSEQARKAMYAALTEMNHIEITRAGIERETKYFMREMADIGSKLDKLALAETAATVEG